MQLHVGGMHAESEAAYRQIMADYPDAPEPKHYLGFLLQQTGRLDESFDLIAESLRLDGSRAEWHYNMGILLARQGRRQSAIESFSTSLKLNPRSYYGWTNLGSLFEKEGDFAGAEQAYQLAAELDRSCPDAFYLLAALYVRQERFDEARYVNCLGFIADPAKNKSKIKLSLAFYETGRVDEAIAMIEKWLAEEPDSPVAAHLRIAFKGLEAPERCSPQYVESTYDDFASSFDSTLTRLKYSGPRLIAEELEKRNFAPGSLMVLDLGCGTGMSGESLKPVSLRLTGVDISQSMLDKAGEKGLYDCLVKSDIGEFLENSNDMFDLIACADTLIYFGNLESIFAQTGERLKQGGLFVFTTEKLDPAKDGRDYCLNITGRYSHKEDFVSRLLVKAGFSQPKIAEVIIRHEHGQPVAGQFFCAQKRME